MITIYLGPISANERRRLRRWAARAETPGHPPLWTAELIKVYFFGHSGYGEDAIKLSSTGVAELSEGELAGVALHEVLHRLRRLVPHKLVSEHVCAPSFPTDRAYNLRWAERYARRLKAGIPLPDGYEWVERANRPKQSA